MKRLDARRIAAFRRTVRAAHRAHGRDRLPWRRTRDPYRILVSEFMLQQTQAGRVEEKYGAFLEAFPDVRALAAAPLREVLRAWSGLGYNRRAVALRETARAVVARHGGKVPRDRAALLALPGIGPASAAAIAAFAFGEAHPLVETNVRAVFIHHFFPRRRAVGDEEILPLVEATIDRRDPRRWYWALMDYGVVLKRERGNPARRGRRRARQGRFEGSTRQARGLVLRAIAGRSMSERRLAAETGLPPARVRAAVAALEREGTIARRGTVLAVAST